MGSRTPWLVGAPCVALIAGCPAFLPEPEPEPVHCDWIESDQYCREYLTPDLFDVPINRSACDAGLSNGSGAPGLWRVGECPEEDGLGGCTFEMTVDGYEDPAVYRDVFYRGYFEETPPYITVELTQQMCQTACESWGGVFDALPLPTDPPTSE